MAASDDPPAGSSAGPDPSEHAAPPAGPADPPTGPGEGAGTRRRPRRSLRDARFAAALLGVLLAGITPNPPTEWLGWLQLIGASVMTGVATTTAVRDRPGRADRSQRGRRVRDWFDDTQNRKWLAVGVVVTVAVALAAPPLVGAARGVSYRLFGCPPATQLRMVADPETIMTAQDVAAAYERATADDDQGCPTTRIFIFEAPAATVVDRLRSGNGWAGSGALKEVGPRPDLWLASTGHQADRLTTGAPPGVVVDRATIARSPLVLAVPPPRSQPGAGWSELVRDVTAGGRHVVRSDPAGGELGLLATALLYGDPAETADPPLAAPEVERRLDAAQDTADLLCHLRDSPEDATRSALITSEQEVARYNNGQALGGSCGATPAERQAPPLIALYPTDTGDQDLQLVRLGTDPVQQDAAAAFGRWLLDDDGATALVHAGLRPVRPSAYTAPLTTENGVDPTQALASQPLPPERWAAAVSARAVAQRPSRLLFLLDTSGSMNASDGPDRTRLRVAADALRAGLTRLGTDDEFGLWFFPGGTGSGYAEAVPVGPRTDARAAAAATALADVRADGTTPLFRTLVDGATALPTDDGIGVSALVVVTDGEDNARAATATDTAREVAGHGVQVVVVTLGDLRCARGGLPTIVGATGGDCEDADATTVGTHLQDVVTRLRGGR